MAKQIPREEAESLWAEVSPDVRERIRVAIAGLERLRAKGKARRPGVNSVRDASGVAQQAAAAITKLYKAGFCPDLKADWTGGLDGSPTAPADDPHSPRQAEAGPGDPPPAPAEAVAGEEPRGPGRPPKKSPTLAEQIRSIETRQDAIAALIEGAAQAVEGKLTKHQADSAKALISEARQHLKDARDDPGETTDRQLFLSPSALELVRLWEGIVSEERRERVLRMVVAEFELDLLEHPEVDTAAQAQPVAEAS